MTANLRQPLNLCLAGAGGLGCRLGAADGGYEHFCAHLRIAGGAGDSERAPQPRFNFRHHRTHGFVARVCRFFRTALAHLDYRLILGDRLGGHAAGD